MDLDEFWDKFSPFILKKQPNCLLCGEKGSHDCAYWKDFIFSICDNCFEDRDQYTKIEQHLIGIMEKNRFTFYPIVEHEFILSSGPMTKEKYRQYLKTQHWEALKNSAKENAGSKCQLCNKEGSIHVHHRTYENLGNEKLSDLTVLCDDCHNKFHDKFSLED